METVIEVELDDGFLERLEDRSIDQAGSEMAVDAVAVNIMIGAYRERDRLRNDLADLNEGRSVVLPNDRKHAEHMYTVAEAFLNSKMK